MKVSAYCDKTNIYTILKFPIVAQPMYDILNVISLPTYNYVNKFAYTQVDNTLIAANKDMRTYVILTKQNLNDCLNNNNQYLYEKNQPIYHESINKSCEIKMYIRAQDYREHCNVDYMITNRTIWITLHQPHSWVYSTASEQQIAINCDNHPE